MTIRTEIEIRLAGFPRRHRAALRAALSMPGCDLTYEQARLIQRYRARQFARHPGSRIARLGLATADSRVARLEAERQLRAHAYGGTVEAIKSDALRQGAALFGPDAELEIVSVENLTTAFCSGKGAFRGAVTVRMLPGPAVGAS